MAQHKISGNDVLLYVSTDGVTYDTVICLTSNAITRATSIIDANSKCGPDSLPGVQSNTLTFEGQVMLDPSGSTTSVDELDDYWRTKQTIYWKMGPVSPAIGDITYYGTGFIATLDETAAIDTPMTFSGSIGIYGIINKTTATS